MSVIYRFNNPGAGLTVRLYQAGLIDAAKILIDSVAVDTLSVVDGKLQWTVAAADPGSYSWLASWDGYIEGAYSAVIPPETELDTVLISMMVPRLIGDVPGSPRSVIMDALRKAIRDFCSRTQMWKYTVGDILPIEGLQTYSLLEPNGTEICSIVQARQETAGKLMTARYTIPATKVKGNLVEFYGRPSRDEISVYPLPSDNATDPFIVTVSLQPTLSGTEVDRKIHSRWEDTFLNGARFRLMSMPKKPWTDTGMAAFYRSQYDAEVSDALVEMVKGGTNEVTTMEYPEFI